MFNYKGAFEDYDKAVCWILKSRDHFNRAIIPCLAKFQSAIDDCNHAERLKYNNENLYTVRGAAKSDWAQSRMSIQKILTV